TPELETRVAPRNNVEEKLAEIWSQLLKIEQSRIGIDDNFFHLGGHSLKATRLIARIHSALNVEVPLPELFAKPTIRALSAYIETSGHDKFISIKAVEKKENYPLSSAQKRMFLLQQMESTGTGYNMPLVVRLEGTLDRERLENIFRELIDRHESFRTTFEMRNGEAVQVIHNAGKIEIHVEYYETSGREKNEEDIIDGLIRPFDLSCAPLVRVGVIKKENTVASTPTHILVLDMHHIISDGVSFGILVRDLMSLFKGDELAPLRIQYKDFSEWQNRLFKTPEIKKQQAWWHRKFERKIEVMELPYDYPRPPTQSFAGSSFYSEINKTKTAALTEQALKHEVTLFMELVALYSILLSRLSNREEVVVGVPTAGRSHADLEPVIGMFVNTLPLRSKPGGDKTFESFLEEVGRQTLQAFENQALPFEELVEQLEVERSLSRNPLFDVMFTLNNMEISRVEIPGLRLTPYKRENKDAKFDLTLSATEEEDKIHLEYEYCTALFKEETVRRFDTIFQRIIDAVLETPDIKLAKIEIIPGEEKKRILYEFNETAVEYPRHETIHGLVEKQAQKHPDRLAVSSITQIREGETGELTFGRLNDKSHALAVVLRQKGIGPGRIVGIMDTPSLETVVGMLGVLKAGGAWLPTAPGTSTERIAYMLADSNATLLLTRTRHKEKAKEIRDKVEKITTDAPGILLIDEPIKPGAEDTHPPLPGRDAANTAYIIYTSGSTGQPKGVAVPHRAFVNRQYSLKRRFHIDEGDVVLQKASNTFDVSVCELFRGLSWGAAVVIAGTVVDTDMEELVRIIETYKVTLLEFVPIVLNLFLEYIDNHGAAARVARLRQAFVGGEAVESETVKRFHRVIYERCGTQLVNAYGPTEAAVDVSWYDCTGGNAGEVPVKIPIGKPIANTTIVIIDRNLQLMPIGIPGELCIAGDSLGSGYLNRPELTAEKFAKNLRTRPADTPNNQSPITNNRLYRTGDLARWQPDGNIEFMGRIDRQLKIRGFRIEPGEIENLLLQHEKVKEAVVLAREYKAQKGDKYLCAYIVTGGTQEAGDTMEVAALTKELESCLSKELPGYMVPQYFIELETVPLTVNGKVDVNTLPEPVAKGKSERYAAPQSDIEKKLVEMWSQLLEIDRKNIGIDDNFFRLGGHSLKAFVLVSKIHKHLNVKMSPAEIFKQPTIRSMAQFIKTMVEDKWETIEPLEKREHYPLSSAQSRLFTLNVIEDDNVVYNLPAVWQLKGKLSLSKFEEAFQTMAARHESLRTSFQIRAGEPVQVIEENVEPTVEYHVTEAGSDKEQYSHTTITQFLRPFDLSKAPLLRVALIRLEEEKHLLLMDIHHIISDGVTMVILVNEFIRLYENKELPRLTIQYKDFAQWQNRFFRSKAFKKQENYWQEIFKDGAPLLNMPLDYPRTRERRPEGKILPFTIDKELTHRLKSCASETGVTLYMTLLAIYNILLSRYSGQEDIVVGLPIAGRKHADLENIAGFFINTLAIRNQPENRHTFNGFMQKVKENVLKAYDNQDYPFDRLVSNLKIPKDMSRNPLFDAMLVLQNTAPLDTFESLELGAYDFEHNISHFDLHLEATEYEGKINMKLEYATALFKRETAEEFTRHYIELTRQVMENTNIQLKELEISFDLLVSRSSILDEDQGDFGF
ncbi:MAG: amino acid adenylation domain-containing protein, partial [bacterium]|nr:amino acid adenylation domain-containing protein [bacterium]